MLRKRPRKTVKTNRSGVLVGRGPGIRLGSRLRDIESLIKPDPLLSKLPKVSQYVPYIDILVPNRQKIKRMLEDQKRRNGNRK